MKWYLVKLVFKITCGEGKHSAQFDEQIRLVEAESPEEALKTGGKIGIDETEAFINANMQLVKWIFIGISDLIALESEYHGAEVYSRIIETDFEEGYLKLFKNQSDQLQNLIFQESY